MSSFEVVVIGGGPAGVTAALRARELGADVALGSGVAAAQQVFLEAGIPAAQPVG